MKKKIAILMSVLVLASTSIPVFGTAYAASSVEDNQQVSSSLDNDNADNADNAGDGTSSNTNHDVNSTSSAVDDKDDLSSRVGDSDKNDASSEADDHFPEPVNENTRALPDEVNNLENGYYTIGNGSVFIDMNDAGYGENVQAGVFRYMNQNNQLFSFEKQNNGNYKITAVHSQKALTMKDDGTVVQCKWTGDANQQWKVIKDAQGNYYIQNVKNDYSMAMDANNLNCTAYTQADEQKIKLDKYAEPFPYITPAVVEDGMYEIRSTFSNKNLDVYNGGLENGVPVWQCISNNGNNQKWNLKNSRDGKVIFESVSSGRLLDLNMSTDKCVQWERHNGLNQQWYIGKSGNSYYIQNAATDKVLDLYDGSKNDGDYVIAFPNHNGENQKWTFVETTKNDNKPLPPSEEINKLENGYYTIGNGKVVIDMNNAEYGEDVQANVFRYMNQNNQLFSFEKQNNGNYKITAVHSKKALTLQDDGTIMQSKWTGDANQQWKVIKDVQGNYYIQNVKNDYSMAMDANNLNCTAYTQADEQKIKLDKYAEPFPYITPAVVEDGMYEIRSTYSNKNLGVYNNGLENGTPVWQYTSYDSNNQKWNLKNSRDGKVIFESVSSGRLLDLNMSTDKCVQWERHNGLNQQWYIGKSGNSYYIQNAATDKVLDLYDGSKNDGDYVIAFPSHNGENQKWTFVETTKSDKDPLPPSEEVNNLENGYYTIGNDSVFVDMNNAEYGENVQAGVFRYMNQNNQLFGFEKQNNGNYKITAVHSQKALTMKDDGTVVQCKWTGDANQQWKVIKDAQGNYYIQNVKDNRSMTINGNSLNCTNYAQANEQKLKLDKYAEPFPYISPAVVEDGMYEIRSEFSGKNLDVFNNSWEDDTSIWQYTPGEGNNQKWVLTNNRDGYVTLTSVSSGKVINLNHSTGALTQWNNFNKDNQRWIIKNLNGKYYICNVQNGAAVGLKDYSTQDGDYVISMPLQEGAKNQQWNFIETTESSTPVAPEVNLTSSLGDWFQNTNTSTLTVSPLINDNYTYEFSLYYNGRKITLQNYGGSNTYRWTPIDTGEYIVKAAIKRSDGVVTSVSKTINITSNGQSTLTGIDVSEHQKIIDWRAVKNSGRVNYAMIRTGYGIEISTQIDDYFYQNYDGATANDIPVGVYHYSYANTVAGAKEEARFCLNILNGRTLTLPVAYDIEDSDSIVGVDRQTLTDMAIAFCDDVKAAGYQPMIYCNPDYINNRLDLARLREKGYDVWIASYGVADYQFPYPVKMWQFTSKESVPGINGNVDMNHWYVGADYNGNTPLPSGQKGQCTDWDVRVRSTPAFADNILYKAHKGYTFTILEKNGAWYKVAFGGGRGGWIYQDYVRLI